MQTLLALYLNAATDPAVPTTEEDRFRDIGPGFAGFVATAAMVIVVIFLIVDMTRRIRRIRYESEAQLKQDQLADLGQEEAAEREALADAAPEAPAFGVRADGEPGGTPRA
ncbi:hypothetical protein [Galactobacter valiniphilus]|uniref:hypothetical protein n=1 Tax=Galactobacter valiniphilus TaxID=2676122 RepID=UPI003735E73E